MRKFVLIFLLFLFFRGIGIPQSGFLHDNGDIVNSWGIINKGVSEVDYNDFADALFLRMDIQPPAKLKGVISTIYDTLQAYHIDDTLDFFNYYAVHTEQAATLDWIRDTTVTLVNSPVFTIYEGFASDGLSSYVKANYNPGVDAVHYRLDGASVAYYLRTNYSTTTTYHFGMQDASDNITGNLALTTDFFLYLNRAGAATVYNHGGNIDGFTILTRQSSATMAYAVNGGSYTTDSKASVGIPNQANGLYFLAKNNKGTAANWSPNQIASDCGGGELTELQKTKLYQIIEWALDQYGKGVNP